MAARLREQVDAQVLGHGNRPVRVAKKRLSPEYEWGVKKMN
jgi:hypothetical protein